MALVEALDEVSLSLVLAAAGGLAGPPLPREGHEPALMPGILEGRVVVFQHDLREHAVFAFPAGLRGKEGEEGSLSTHPVWLICLWAYFKAEEGLGAQGFLPGEMVPLLGRQRWEKGTSFAWSQIST